MLLAACWSGYVEPESPRPKPRQRVTCRDLEAYVGRIPERPAFGELCGMEPTVTDMYICVATELEHYAAALRWKLDLAITWCGQLMSDARP